MHAGVGGFISYHIRRKSNISQFAQANYFTSRTAKYITGFFVFDFHIKVKKPPDALSAGRFGFNHYQIFLNKLRNMIFIKAINNEEYGISVVCVFPQSRQYLV